MAVYYSKHYDWMNFHNYAIVDIANVKSWKSAHNFKNQLREPEGLKDGTSSKRELLRLFWTHLKCERKTTPQQKNIFKTSLSDMLSVMNLGNL